LLALLELVEAAACGRIRWFSFTLGSVEVALGVLGLTLLGAAATSGSSVERFRLGLGIFRVGLAGRFRLVDDVV
jgi:hypothetical protein